MNDVWNSLRTELIAQSSCASEQKNDFDFFKIRNLKIKPTEKQKQHENIFESKDFLKKNKEKRKKLKISKKG